MASAYQCDRCKSFYIKNKRGVLTSPIHNLCINKRAETRDYYIDLCKDCVSELDAWFSAGQPDEEQDNDDP